jgi:transposase-like protein
MMDSTKKSSTEGDPMLDMMRQFAAQLDHNEKLVLLNDLKVAIAAELVHDPEKPERCPHCGCPLFVCKGKDRRGRQRWLCKGCARTFSAGSKGLLANSKLEAHTWMTFAECMADALALRESASRCGVSLRTAWFMRHRVCEVMASGLATFRSGSRCQVDSTYLAESLTGNHSRSASFAMPRESHRNGKDVHVRGISNLQVCVMTGINELGDCFCELSCRGRESFEDVYDALEGRIDKDSEVTSDMHRSYPGALKALGVAVHGIINPKDRTTGDINMVNALHSRLKEFIGRFHGVATRRLQHYLDWFCYREQFRGSDADRREVLYRHEVKGVYETTWRGYAQTPHPFMGYWGMSTVG